MPTREERGYGLCSMKEKAEHDLLLPIGAAGQTLRRLPIEARVSLGNDMTALHAVCLPNIGTMLSMS